LEPQARDFGLPAPRGVLLVGVPGCGKSLIAKGIAGSWGLPLAALDTGRLHGSLVGESERRIRAALDSVEVMAPAVLWIDEIEKAFGGSGGAEQDGGVSQRVMGVLLGWLQERPDGVFVVATSNDVEALPPELLRRGRFDDVFFVDLPDSAQRREILEQVLRARGRDAGAVRALGGRRGHGGLLRGRARQCGDVGALCRLRRRQAARHSDPVVRGGQDRAAVAPAGRGHRGAAGLGARPSPPRLTFNRSG
jgi:SpoVK/Ycf46/Vps4 family AAA+-type ATPase